MTVYDFRETIWASCGISDHTEDKHPWWNTLVREGEGTFLNLPVGRCDFQNLIPARDEACLEACCSTEKWHILKIKYFLKNQILADKFQYMQL